MKNKCILLLISLNLLACAACGADHNPKIDPNLQILVDHYFRFAPNNGKFETVDSIQFGETANNEERGRCDEDESEIGNYVYETHRKIIISNNIGKMPLPTVLFHELGHCLHGLTHTTGRHDIMNPERDPNPEYWTPENIDTSLQAMFLGLHVD